MVKEKVQKFFLHKDCLRITFLDSRTGLKDNGICKEE